MDLKNNPVAYWAFHTNSLKEDVRDMIGSLAMQKLGMQSPYQETPWNINLFRIEEFTKYGSDIEALEKLLPLRGWEVPSDASPLLSTSDVGGSYFTANSLLKEDVHLGKFVEAAKTKSLNYIIQANHSGCFFRTGSNGSPEVLDFLMRLNQGFHSTNVWKNTEKPLNSIYGFFENTKDQRFVLTNHHGEELKV